MDGSITRPAEWQSLAFDDKFFQLAVQWSFIMLYGFSDILERIKHKRYP